jgi:hypothetical protein
LPFGAPAAAAAEAHLGAGNEIVRRNPATIVPGLPCGSSSNAVTGIGSMDRATRRRGGAANFELRSEIREWNGTPEEAVEGVKRTAGRYIKLGKVETVQCWSWDQF